MKILSICNIPACKVLQPLLRYIGPDPRKEFQVLHRFFSGEASLLFHQVSWAAYTLYFRKLHCWSKVLSEPKSGSRMNYSSQNSGVLLHNPDSLIFLLQE